MPQAPFAAALLATLGRRARPVLVALGNLETRTFGAGDRNAAPGFICGLPRSGTTVLLQILAGHPHVATASVWDTFVPHLPIAWLAARRILRPFLPDSLGERVHGDGMRYRLDSAEASDEPIWTTFFPDLHREDLPGVLDERTSNPQFEAYYRSYLLKLRRRAPAGGRVAVKNNYSLARIGYLRRLFPGARFLIPIRHPVSLVASYLRTHRRILRAEAQEKPLCRFLADLGHFEFGEGLRFVCWEEPSETRRIRALWDAGRPVEALARYWVQAYGAVDKQIRADPALRSAARVIRLEDVAAGPQTVIADILSFVGLDPDRLGDAAAATGWRQPDGIHPALSADDLPLLERLTEELASRCGYGPWRGTLEAGASMR